MVIEGPGSVTRLPEVIVSEGVKKVLIVTGRNVSKLESFHNMLKAADEAGLEYVIFNGVSPNPTSDNVEEGFAAYKSGGCDGFIAFGGGSPMDCAKAIGAKVSRPNKPVHKLQGVFKVMKKLPPFYAVPTTAGSGSETTIAAVITDSATHHKAALNDLVLMPNCAVLDPELTVGLSPFTTAITGMDALSHAVEAYTNHTYNTNLEDSYALEAIRLIYENIIPVYTDGNNIDARRNMQLASFKAGRAFTRGCVGYVHAIGHTLGGLYGVPHGLAMAVLLPKVMTKFGPTVYDSLARIADYCGLSEDAGLAHADNKAKALRFINWIEETNRAMNIPDHFDEIKASDIPQMASWASAEANPIYPVPSLWSLDDFTEIIEGLCD